MPKDNQDEIEQMFFNPIRKTILSGVDKMAQICSSVMLADLIEHLGEVQDPDNKNIELLTKMKDNIVKVVVKSKCDSPQIFDALFNLIKIIHFEDLFNELPDIYEKIIIVLNSKAHFLTKISCIKNLEIIASKLLSNKDLNTGNVQSEIIFTLEKLSSDKQDKVRVASSRALKLWNKVEEKYKDAKAKLIKIEQNKEKEFKEAARKDCIDGGKSGKDLKKNASSSNLISRENSTSNNFSKLKMLRDLNKINKSQEKKEKNSSSLDTDRNKEDQWTKDSQEVYRKGIGNIIKMSQRSQNKEYNTNTSSNTKSSNLNKDGVIINYFLYSFFH